MGERAGAGAGAEAGPAKHTGHHEGGQALVISGVDGHPGDQEGVHHCHMTVPGEYVIVIRFIVKKRKSAI